MEITIKELQEKSYSFVFNGRGCSGTIRIGMIGNSAFSIDDLGNSVFAKRNITSDEELREFVDVEHLMDNDGVEEEPALKFDDLSGYDIEEIED